MGPEGVAPTEAMSQQIYSLLRPSNGITTLDDAFTPNWTEIHWLQISSNSLYTMKASDPTGERSQIAGVKVQFPYLLEDWADITYNYGCQ